MLALWLLTAPAIPGAMGRQWHAKEKERAFGHLAPTITTPVNRVSTSVSVDLGFPLLGKIPVATLPLIMLFANLYPDCLCKMSPLQYYDVAKASP